MWNLWGAITLFTPRGDNDYLVCVMRSIPVVLKQSNFRIYVAHFIQHRGQGSRLSQDPGQRGWSSLPREQLSFVRGPSETKPLNFFPPFTQTSVTCSLILRTEIQEVHYILKALVTRGDKTLRRVGLYK